MKKFVKIVLPLCAFFLPLCGHADTIRGVCKFNNTSLDDLTCYGPTTLTDVTVKGDLNVYGPLTLVKSKVQGKIEVKGVINAEGSEAADTVTVFGPLFANNSSFKAGISSYTQKMSLSKSTVQGNISIESDSNPSSLELKDHAQVKGDINFSKDAGVVQLSKDSAITGSVKNGSKQSV